MARQIRLNVARLWRQLPLRANFYGAEPGVAGTNVAARLALTPDVKPGVYMYVVDGKGKMWLLLAGNDPKHRSIVPAGARVRAAGWLKVTVNRLANINTRSGHYMQEQPFTAQEELTWLQAITDMLLYEGNIAVENASAVGSIM